ncbi:serine/threonine protein kinase, partial [bacterium]|nr:serine/threonine protein kinase [bacterium]
MGIEQSMSQAGADLPTEVSQARNDPRRAFGRFLILGELGKGGMGAVYRAWDERLRRQVALKVVLPGSEQGELALERFKREAEAIARLRHPNIVSVFEVGEVAGKQFLAMDYIQGRTLDRRLGPRAEPKLPLTKALEAVRDVARAVHHAHEQGVVHRDLKPQNIILDSHERPYVLDFGLAQIRDSGTKMTKTGSLLGTPAYMPPEQAGTSETPIDERSDVYSLGATLYHVLTGRPPFEGKSHFKVIAAVVSKDPVPPSSINRRIPPDLETVCLRCLEKESARRYPSAAALAKDIDRFLAGDPIEARPLGRLARLVRRARRNKLTAALLVVAIAAVLGLGGAAVVATRAFIEERERRQKEEADRRADEDRRKLAESARKDEALRKQQAVILFQLAERAIVEGKYCSAALYSAKALSFDESPAYRAAHYLSRQHVWKKPQTLETKRVADLSFSPDSRRMAIATRDGFLRIVSVPDGAPVMEPFPSGGGLVSLSWSPDARSLASGNDDGTTFLWDSATGKQIAKLPGPAGSCTQIVAWSRDSKTLATGRTDGTIAVWDVETCTCSKTLQGARTTVYGVSWSPDGRRLVAGGMDHTVSVWDVATGRREHAFESNMGTIFGLAWSPDGAHVASSCADRTVKVWRVQGSYELQNIFRGHETETHGIAWSPDGHRVACTSADNTVRLWDHETEEFVTLEGYGTHALGVAWSPDGHWVASAGDLGVRLWPAEA